MGTSGYAWSSAPYSATSTSGSNLYFHSSYVNPEGNYNRAYGFPVRCVPDNKSGFSIIGCKALIRFLLMRPRNRAEASENFLFGGQGGARRRRDAAAETTRSVALL